MEINPKLHTLIQKGMKSNSFDFIRQAIEIGYGLGMSDKNWQDYFDQSKTLDVFVAEKIEDLLEELEEWFTIPRGKPYRGSLDHDVTAFYDKKRGYIGVSIYIEEDSHTLEDWEIIEMIDEQIKERIKGKPFYIPKGYKSEKKKAYSSSHKFKVEVSIPVDVGFQQVLKLA
jgi:hypothetical protein